MQEGRNLKNVKKFLIRECPVWLHTQWKAAADILGITMEEFALKAIKKMLDDYLALREKEMEDEAKLREKLNNVG